MKPNAYEISFVIDGEYIAVTWTLAPELAGSWDYRYPKLEMQFKYTDISQDTVKAMLREMEVPNTILKTVMTSIAAHAT